LLAAVAERYLGLPLPEALNAFVGAGPAVEVQALGRVSAAARASYSDLARRRPSLDGRPSESIRTLAGLARATVDRSGPSS
jgi:hypothetical protein